MSYTILYSLWAVLFAVTAAMGFIPAPEGAAKVVCQLMAAVFFIPGWLILVKANKEDAPRHKRIVRSLCIASLSATVVMMVLNILSAAWSEPVGNALHAALTIVSAPMICGQRYLLGIFMWGCLLMGSKCKVHC